MFWKKSIKKEFLKTLNAKFKSAQKAYDEGVKRSKAEKLEAKLSASAEAVRKHQEADVAHESKKAELLTNHVNSLLG